MGRGSSTKIMIPPIDKVIESTLLQRLRGEVDLVMEELGDLPEIPFSKREGQLWAKYQFIHAYWPLVEVVRLKSRGYGLLARRYIAKGTVITGYYGTYDDAGSEQEKDIYQVEINGRNLLNGVHGANNWKNRCGYQFFGALANHSYYGKHPNALLKFVPGCGLEIPVIVLIAGKDISEGQPITWSYQLQQKKGEQRYSFDQTCSCCSCASTSCGCILHEKAQTDIIERNCSERTVTIINSCSSALDSETTSALDTDATSALHHDDDYSEMSYGEWEESNKDSDEEWMEEGDHMSSVMNISNFFAALDADIIQEMKHEAVDTDEFEGRINVGEVIEAVKQDELVKGMEERGKMAQGSRKRKLTNEQAQKNNAQKFIGSVLREFPVFVLKQENLENFKGLEISRTKSEVLPDTLCYFSFEVSSQFSYYRLVHEKYEDLLLMDPLRKKESQRQEMRRKMKAYSNVWLIYQLVHGSIFEEENFRQIIREVVLILQRSEKPNAAKAHLNAVSSCFTLLVKKEKGLALFREWYQEKSKPALDSMNLQISMNLNANIPHFTYYELNKALEKFHEDVATDIIIAAKSVNSKKNTRALGMVLCLWILVLNGSRGEFYYKMEIDNNRRIRIEGDVIVLTINMSKNKKPLMYGLPMCFEPLIRLYIEARDQFYASSPLFFPSGVDNRSLTYDLKRQFPAITPCLYGGVLIRKSAVRALDCLLEGVENSDQARAQVAAAAGHSTKIRKNHYSHNKIERMQANVALLRFCAKKDLEKERKERFHKVLSNYAFDCMQGL